MLILASAFRLVREIPAPLSILVVNTARMLVPVHANSQLQLIIEDSELQDARCVKKSKSSRQFVLSAPGGQEECTTWSETGLYPRQLVRYISNRPCDSGGTSANPSRNLMAASCCQLFVAPMSAANVPQTRPKPGKKTLGRTRVRIIFAGTTKLRLDTSHHGFGVMETGGHVLIAIRLVRELIP
jgi:hypothetical protein